MNPAKHYARALYALIENPLRHPPAGGADGAPKQSTVYLQNLAGVLKRRGHSALFPRIFTEYRALTMQHERSKAHTHITPEQERTRILLELYKKLTTV